MKRRVVVTGLGLVTPVGNSVETTWSALMEGRSGADYIKKFDAERFPCRFACEVNDFDPLNYVEKKEARKMGAFIQYAIDASQEAMDDSGLKITDEIAEAVAVWPPVSFIDTRPRPKANIDTYRIQKLQVMWQSFPSYRCFSLGETEIRARNRHVG